jgi:hypothetical protein
MPPVELPTQPGPRSAEPRLVDYRGIQVPFLGGPVTHLDRMGTRLALAVNLPAMRHDTEAAMAWVADLLTGRRDGVVMEWPQPDYDAPDDGTILGDVSGGDEISLTGLTPGQTIRKGSFLSISHGGRWYIHNVSSATQVVPGSGNVDLTIFPELREEVFLGDEVRLTAPVIEGYLEGDELTWTLEEARTVGLSFTVVEEE